MNVFPAIRCQYPTLTARLDEFDSCSHTHVERRRQMSGKGTHPAHCAITNVPAFFKPGSYPVLPLPSTDCFPETQIAHGEELRSTIEEAFSDLPSRHTATEAAALVEQQDRPSFCLQCSGCGKARHTGANDGARGAAGSHCRLSQNS